MATGKGSHGARGCLRLQFLTAEWTNYKDFTRHSVKRGFHVLSQGPIVPIVHMPTWRRRRNVLWHRLKMLWHPPQSVTRSLMHRRHHDARWTSSHAFASLLSLQLSCKWTAPWSTAIPPTKSLYYTVFLSLPLLYAKGLELSWPSNVAPPPPPQPKVECCLLPKSTCRYDVVRRNLDKYLHDTSTQVFPHTEIKDYDDSPFLRENVEFIKIYEARGNILFHPWTWFFESSGENLNSRFTHPSSPWPHGQLGFTCQGNSSDIVSLASVTLQIHVYQLSEEDSVDEYGEEDAEVSTANNWILPSRGLDGVWDRYVSVFMVCLKKTPPDR